MKRTFITFLIMNCAQLLYAQSLVVTQNNGDKSRFPISEISNITFEILSIPTDGLVAYYPFNGNANDDSGNGFNGTVNGVILTSDSHEASNMAYLFNNSYISIPSNALNDLPKGTVSVFIYVNEINKQHTVLDKTFTGLINYFQLIVDSNNKLRVFMNTKSDYSYSKSTLSANTWYHVAVTWDGQNFKYYINGILDNTVSNNRGVPNVDRNTFVGKVDNNSAYMNGKIDNLIIYNRALTEQEIKSLAQE